MQRFRHPLLLLTVVACACTIAAVAMSPRWTERSIADALRMQIDSAEEPQAARLVEKLQDLNDSAITHLVQLLDDDRPAVRIAARETLRGPIDEWMNDATADSDRGAALLAQSLAAHDPPRDLHNRVFVKLTALKLLRRTMTSDAIDQAAFLADCSAVLGKTVRGEEGEQGSGGEGERFASASTGAASPELVAEVVDSLPFAEAAADSFVATEEQSVSDDPLPEDGELAGLPNQQSAISNQQFSPNPQSPSPPQLLPRGEEHAIPPSRFQPDAPRRVRPGEIAAPLHLQLSAVDEKALHSLSTRSLMRHLHGVPQIAAAAEAELKRRGFKEGSLVVARALDDPDPRVRLRLVEAIPSIEGIDPAAWLWELTEDSDERVRRAALAVLSTSANPMTRQRVARRHESSENR